MKRPRVRACAHGPVRIGRWDVDEATGVCTGNEGDEQDRVEQPARAGLAEQGSHGTRLCDQCRRSVAVLWSMTPSEGSAQSLEAPEIYSACLAGRVSSEGGQLVEIHSKGEGHWAWDAAISSCPAEPDAWSHPPRSQRQRGARSSVAAGARRTARSRLRCTDGSGEPCSSFQRNFFRYVRFMFAMKKIKRATPTPRVHVSRRAHFSGQRC